MNVRHRTSSAELSGRILDAALAILDENGAEALTVRGIATRANVAPMGIYNRFESINGVYEALWIEGFERLTEALSSAEPIEDPVAGLMECGRRYRGFALKNPAHYRLLFLEFNAGYTPSLRAAEVASQSLQILVNNVERCQAHGLMANLRSIDVAQNIWSSVHGFVSLELHHLNFAVDADANFELLLNAVYRGLAAQPESD